MAITPETIPLVLVRKGKNTFASTIIKKYIPIKISNLVSTFLN